MELTNNLKKTEEKKGKIPKESELRERKSESTKPVRISFDAYFRMLMKEGKVQAHHKAPLKMFVQERLALEATRSDFDRVFVTY